MWNHAIKSYHTSAERSRNPLHYHPFVYMSSSSGASSNTALQERHQFSIPLGHNTMNHLSVSGVGDASNAYGPPKGYRKFDSGISSSTMSNNISYYKPDMVGSVSNISQLSGRGSVLKNDKGTNSVQVVKNPLVQNFENSNYALCINRGYFSSKDPVSTLSSKTTLSTASHIQPQGSNLGECRDKGERSSMPSSLCRQEKFNYVQYPEALRKTSRVTDTISKQECNHQFDSTVLSSNKRLDICSTSTKSLMPMSRKNYGSFPMLNNYQPAFGPLEEVQLSGANSSHIDKDTVSLKLSSTDAFASAGKGNRRKRVMPEIPDLNIALADLPDSEDVMENSDPSINRTKCSEKTSVHAVQPGSTSRGKKRCKTSSSGSILKSPSAQGMEESEDASGLISFGTKGLNLGDSHPREILNRSFRKFREGGLNKSGLTFSGKEVIMLDSDDGPASVTISRSSSKELIKVEKNIASDKNSKSQSAQGMEKTEDACGSNLFGTKSINLGESNPHEIASRSFRKLGEGGLNKSELTYAGKEIIVLDSDDDADDGPASVTFTRSSSKELMEVEKNIASDKTDKSPSAQRTAKTEEVTCLWPQNWPLYTSTVRLTGQENPEPSVVHNPHISHVASGSSREREVPRAVATDVIKSVSNKKQIEIQNKVQNNML
ncbi:uncharacterized protein LOC108201493 [Daucus carota subsp. sativus]|uniref:uncharacterized protein LOC108201493 n=1 Tax=Daucus carota subsp. sativus TaxID=79200 RepID=UPI0007EF6C40|nr:PREDICTED: uncharacterized protein LOC108201493 [Daucus carota subsp. sativus]XP_017225272.1 PREDICTED: uncharacterized protein LOC108201493 [Daucus carota subsp. sativus]XP_017225279.1 PREDICTED: uncharacterized protein LOC108201493 [Daucus carota subsp. sativus]XP_017225287.1 PREDICTED: uncharacterized protein LOC108201493 [Daucus carota subsp. sativus]XP_017225295.1 PREDICTED: uncharacterized protein LOC108201493 [Daucus carota subsp. sativus]XP_017225301.1 PREDICTED: uncharacterized pro